jgi:hypothetical protein
MEISLHWQEKEEKRMKEGSACPFVLIDNG